MRRNDEASPVNVCRDIPGFAGYRVSAEGVVWSCRTHDPLRPFSGVWKRRALGLTTNGYLYVVMSPSPKAVRKLRQVHRLVLEAFVGPCPEGMEARHLDGDKRNNRLENLCWGTPKENASDRERHGTHPRGESSPVAKLTAADVEAIRRLKAEGVSLGELSRRYGVSHIHVRRIVRGESWRPAAAVRAAELAAELAPDPGPDVIPL
jgi:DNA-binding transcriptional regulator YiaG